MTHMRGPLLIIIAALMWSFDGILRRSLFVLPPAVIVFWEHMLGFAILTPFLIGRLPEIRRLGRGEWISLFAVSLLSGALGTILYTAALARVNYIQFSVVVLLQQLQPVWAILFARILLKEKIGVGYFKWSLLAVVSSYFVTFRDLSVDLSSGPSTVFAAILALSAGMAWGVSTSFSKIVLRKISPLSATWLRFAFAALFAFILTAAFGQTRSLTTLSTIQWTTLVMITCSTGMVALVLYYYGLARVRAQKSAILELVWPVSAICIDFLIFNRPLSITQALGSATLLYSMYRLTAANRQQWIRGRVLKGRRLGRKIGFPTVNLDARLLPAGFIPGVYGSRVRFRGREYQALLYFGPRYVAGESHNALEIHISGFDRQIYGEYIEFTVLQFIRKPKRIKTLIQLKQQLSKDMRKTSRYK